VNRGKLAKLEKLAKRYLLWAFQGNAYPARLLTSPANKKRAGMIRHYARLARRPQIASQLPGEEMLSFFEAEPKQGYAEKLLAIEAFLLGIRELAPDSPWIARQLELVHKLQQDEREAPAKILAKTLEYCDAFAAALSRDMPALQAAAGGDMEKLEAGLKEWRRQYAARHGGADVE